GAHLFSHDAKAPDGLIVTRDTSFFTTYCYLIANLESSCRSLRARESVRRKAASFRNPLKTSYSRHSDPDVSGVIFDGGVGGQYNNHANRQWIDRSCVV